MPGSYELDVKACPKCETAFKKKKYRVCVSVKGKRVTRFFDKLTLAREAETAIKADILRGDLDIKQKSEPIPTLYEVWAKYLPWAKKQKPGTTTCSITANTWNPGLAGSAWMPLQAWTLKE